MVKMLDQAFDDLRDADTNIRLHGDVDFGGARTVMPGQT